MDEVERLIKEVRDNWQLRKKAATALGETGDPRAVDDLIRALDDANVRVEAARALIKIGEPAVGPLVHSLKYDKYAPCSTQYTLIVINILRELKDERAIEVFIAALDRRNKKIQKAASKAIKEFKDERTVETLIRILMECPSYGTPELRKIAAKLLGEICDNRATPFLIKVLGKEVRPSEVTIKGKKVPSFEEELRDEAEKALVNIGVPAVSALIQAMDGHLRSIALNILNEIISKSILNELTTEPESSLEELAKLCAQIKEGIEKFNENSPFYTNVKEETAKILMQITGALENIIREQRSIEKLDEIRACLIESVEVIKKLDKDSSTYQDAKEQLVRLLILVSKRKNSIGQIDLLLDSKIRPPTPKTPKGGIYRVQQPRRVIANA